MSEWCVAGAVRAMTARTVVPEKIANRSAAGFRCRSSLRKRSSSNGYVNENKRKRSQNQTEKKEPHHSSIYSGPPGAPQSFSGQAAQFVNVPVDTFIAHFRVLAQKLIG